MKNEDAGDDTEGDDHSPINPEEDWLAIVPHVYAREERTQDESKDPHVIYPQPKRGDLKGVVHEGVVAGGKKKGYCSREDV
jgi:hypothetical protein